MNISFGLQESKQEVFKTVQRYLDEHKLKVTASDFDRPWGGFFVIDEEQAGTFAKHFFPGIEINELKISGKLSPKILMVEPRTRLSWQYHHRRAEIWKLVAGEAGVITSSSDVEGSLHPLKIGEIVKLDCGQRHRLVGLERWGMIAEIWQHTDLQNPSDENDIVRVQDDFGRSVL